MFSQTAILCPRSLADEDVMLFWLGNVWRQSSTRRLLIWDSFSAHKTKRVKEMLSTTYNSGPSCSKLMTSLVNDSLKFTSSDTQIC